jgi:putative transposase
MTLALDEELLAGWASIFKMAPREQRVSIANEAALSLACSTDTFRRRVAEASSKTAKSRKRGQHRSKVRAHELADKVIKERWLTTARPTVPDVYELYEVWCDDAKHSPTGAIKPLSDSTFQRKIDAIPDEEKFRYRKEPKLSKYQFKVKKGKSPRRDGPLEAVQIDHTRLDLGVSDRFGSILGRPWFTAVIDEYTRALIGFHISLLPPQRLTVGLAFANAIFPKKEWLESLGVAWEWDMDGIPFMVRTDNGSDLTAPDTRRGFQKLGVVSLDYRPVGAPQYGAIIERFMGSCATMVKGLPGYCGRFWNEQPELDPEKTSCYTIEELERLIAIWAITKYNNTSTGKRPPPVEMWKDAQRRMLPTMCNVTSYNKLTAERFFLPTISPAPTVTAHGVRHLHLDFNSSYLNRFMANTDPKFRKPIFYKDPRSILQIYHFDEESNEFVTIPLCDPILDQMSWAEYETFIKPTLAKRGVANKTLQLDGRRAIEDIRKGALTRQRNQRNTLRAAETQRRFIESQVKVAQELAQDIASDESWLKQDYIANVTTYR